MAELPTQPCIRRTLASVGGTLGGCVEKIAMVTATWAGKGLILNNVLQRVRQQQTKRSNMAMNFCAPRQIFAGRLESKRLKLSLKTDCDSNPAIWALCNNYLPHPHWPHPPIIHIATHTWLGSCSRWWRRARRVPKRGATADTSDTSAMGWKKNQGENKERQYKWPPTLAMYMHFTGKHN